MLVSSMRPAVKKVITVLDYVIELVLFTYLIPTAVSALVKVFESGRTSTAMGMPMWILQAAPVVGFILADLRILQKICQKIRKREEDEICTQ